jgi:Asp/Glu/hydantoin racemase
MSKKLCLIHTINNFMDIIYNPFGKPFAEANPDIEVMNIMDDSLLKDTLAAGGPTNAVCSRILNYVECGAKAGADVAMVTCTSVNSAAQYARQFASIPIFNIDEPVAKMAIEAGKKIGVLATLPTSPGATIRLLDQEAARQGVDIVTVPSIAEGAFDVLCAGNRPKHDEMVSEALFQLAKEVDVIMFAQISMSLVPHDDPGIPVFKIGTSGFSEAKRLLDTL